MLLTYSYSLLANLVNSMHRSNSRGGRRVLEPFYGFPVRSVGAEEVFFVRIAVTRRVRQSRHSFRCIAETSRALVPRLGPSRQFVRSEKKRKSVRSDVGIDSMKRHLSSHQVQTQALS